ncbi:MAG: hypothetical protein EZS28_000967 [Streblomastix strix]|uniref:Uncharacterized protein n=1 Tax=Streblomastix strix TaxID=222440 RepID=A0A5J4X9C9_9EUKA|nr:MAG: hypothetical protein EZS28_000967 [Streblomastix strix]
MGKDFLEMFVKIDFDAESLRDQCFIRSKIVGTQNRVELTTLQCEFDLVIGCNCNFIVQNLVTVTITSNTVQLTESSIKSFNAV